MRAFATLATIICWTWLLDADALADKRVALVIGNSGYANVARLSNPVNDAAAVASLLRKSGFDVVEGGNDLGVAAMRRAISEFADTASEADVAVVFYAGHGIEIDGINYIVPVDAALKRDIDVDDEAIPLDRVLKVLDPAKRLRLIILDACRDNPFLKSMRRTHGGRSLNRGLAKVEPSTPDTLIAFAAKAGSIAADGEGPNSPFTDALLKHIASPGLDLRLAFGRVRDDVMKITRNGQEPFIYGSLGGSVIALVPESGKPADIDMARLELSYWESIKNDNNPQLFQSYLNRYPKGIFAEIAAIRLQEQKTAALASASVDELSDKAELQDPQSVREVRQRLYELNFDPGMLDGPIDDATRRAIREFEKANRLASTGEITQGLLRRLREISGLKPWGTIVYSKTDRKWGMAWAQNTRAASVASARASCGDASVCPVEISFFGTECGAFAYSDANWTIVARASMQRAKAEALSGCHKGGKACRIVASVCADGAERYGATN